MRTRLQALRRSLDRAGEKFSEESLIRVDFKVLLLTFILVLLFVLSVGLKLHGSSIGYWDIILPEARPGDAGLIAGEPKSIRSDEWMVGTPWALSQHQEGYPVHNYNVGAHSDPLLNNIPAEHFSNIFKPQNWGFFILDFERGFSLWWNFKTFGLLFGFFLLLMVLTRNHFWLSLTGALWVLLSGFTQWWYSTMMVELLASFALAFVGLCYLFLARKKGLVALGAVLLLVFGLDFVLFFYPPFQVPLAWLALVLAAAFLSSDGRWQLMRSRLRTRLPLTAGLGLAAAAVLFLFYQDSRETVTAILNTDYPGRRVNTGGNTGLVRMFSGFTWAPYGELDYPAAWANASETSNFFILFPVVMLAWLHNFVLRIRNSRVVTFLLAYLLVITAWILTSFPEAIARLSLLSYVSVNRILLALGVASILVTITYLAGSDDRPMDRRLAVVAALGFFALVALYCLRYIDATGEDLSYRYVPLIAGFFALLSWLLLTRRRAAFAVLILLALTPYIDVNPLARGMGPVYGNPVYQAGAELAAAEPDERWIVYGNHIVAAMLKASGMEVVNGVKYTPDLDFYDDIDPGDRNRSIYNRYAHTTFSEPADPSAPVTFRLLSADAYAVDISPCSDEMKDLDIDRFAFTKQPEPESLECLVLLRDTGVNDVAFYVRKDDAVSG